MLMVSPKQAESRCSAGTHQGRALSSQRTTVPPRLLSSTLEVQGLLEGVTLGWTPEVSPEEGEEEEELFNSQTNLGVKGQM